MSTIKFAIAQRRVAAALGLMTLAGALMGCATRQMAEQRISAPVPTDYRNRHPIVLREAPRTVELFIGNRRGELTQAQRNDVYAFAGEWRREATGGILVDLPSGSSNEMAAANALH